MISISIIISLLFLHWVADFVCQTDWMARNKSQSNWPLFVHCLVYTMVFIPFAVVVIPASSVAWFLIFTLLLHMYIDFNTSRITSRLSAEGKYGSNYIPNFGMFSIIGLDQFLHYLCLIGTYYFFTTY